MPERKEIFEGMLKMGGARRLRCVGRTKEIRSVLRMHLTIDVNFRWETLVARSLAAYGER